MDLLEIRAVVHDKRLHGTGKVEAGVGKRLRGVS